MTFKKLFLEAIVSYIAFPISSDKYIVLSDKDTVKGFFTNPGEKVVILPQKFRDLLKAFINAVEHFGSYEEAFDTFKDEFRKVGFVSEEETFVPVSDFPKGFVGFSTVIPNELKSPSKWKVSLIAYKNNPEKYNSPVTKSFRVSPTIADSGRIFNAKDFGPEYAICTGNSYPYSGRKCA